MTPRTSIQAHLDQNPSTVGTLGGAAFTTTQKLAVRTSRANAFHMLLGMAIFCLLVGAGTQKTFSQESIPSPAREDRISVMAVVNGTQINRQELSQHCLLRFGEQVLKTLIERQLIINEAARYNIQITDEEIQKEVEMVAAKWGLSVDRWMQLLQEERNVSPAKYREFLWNKLTLRRLAEGKYKITPEEIDQVLESEVGEKVQIRQIVCETRELAQEVLELARREPDSFGRLAREYSQDTPSAANSGIIEPVRKYSKDPRFEELAFSMEEGQISDIVEINEMFYILRCERHLPATPITPQQEQIARQGIIEHLRQKKIAETADALFDKLKEETRIVNVMNDEALQQRHPGVAAIVGNVEIPFTTLAEECITRHGIEVLEGEISRIILQQELGRRNVKVTEDDLHAEIARAAEANGMVTESGNGDIDAWLEYMAEEGDASIEVYVQDAVWPSVALKLLVENNIEVTDEDMDKAWTANFGERVKALGIVLRNQRKAQDVWELATANPSKEYFGNLAFTYSVDPVSQSLYGEIPEIERYGGRPRLEDEAFMLKPGEISGVINVGEYWFILMCLGRTKPVVTDRDDPVINRELYNDLYEKKMRFEMEKKFLDLKESASVDNFLLGTSSSPRTQRPARVPTDNGGRVPFRSNGQ